jgi:hypothetical protein
MLSLRWETQKKYANTEIIRKTCYYQAYHWFGGHDCFPRYGLFKKREPNVKPLLNYMIGQSSVCVILGFVLTWKNPWFF